MCKAIERAGAKAFRDDRDIAGGDDIPDVIQAEIKRSQEVVVFLTQNSRKSVWVPLEIGIALGWNKRKRITTVLYMVKIDHIPAILRSKKAVAINDMEQFVSELRARVKKVRP